MSIRVLHCRNSVGNNAWTLSRAEQKIGIDSHMMVLRPNRFGFPFEESLYLNECKSAIGKIYRVVKYMKEELPNYDIIHFNAGASFLSFEPLHLYHLDLPYIKSLGKKIVITYQGSEARQVSYGKRNFDISPYKGVQVTPRIAWNDSGLKKKVNKIDRFADAIFYLNPDHQYLLPSRAMFRPYSKLDLNQYECIGPRFKGDTINVVHAPTNRTLKGTAIIERTMKRIMEIHPNRTTFQMVENLTHEDALEVYRNADIVIDQLLIGWYGGLAVEAMAYGKPVIAYIRQEDLHVIPAEMRDEIPIVNACEDTLFNVMVSLLEDKERLCWIGLKGRSYVERWHDPIKIAYQMKECYQSVLDLP